MKTFLTTRRLIFTMKGAANGKVVTSGRLTGRSKVVRRRLTPNPEPAPCPEAAFSLYSTDAEDQVTSLHKGLDRCAALLNGILQAEKSESAVSRPTAVKGGGAKSTPSTSLMKRTSKKLPARTDQRSCQSAQRGAGGGTPRSKHQSPVPAAHSGVKLRPPQKSRLTSSHSRTLQKLSPSICPSKHQASVPAPQLQTSGLSPRAPPHSDQPDSPRKAESDGEDLEIVPVRDVDANAAVRHADAQRQPCPLKTSNAQLEPGRVDRVSQDTYSRAETEGEVKTVHLLLGELKALITGQGSVAETLLSRLEQAVSSQLMDAGSANIQNEVDQLSLQRQNAQLSRRVGVLQQQLQKEKTERQNVETLYISEASARQEELTNTRTRLHELQDELTGLRKVLEDTQSQLRDRETKTALMKTELEDMKSRLWDSERQKSELASLAQQRLEETRELHRTLQSLKLSDGPTVPDSSEPHQRRQEPPSDHISQYLMSLGKLERPGNTREPSQPDVRSQQGDQSAETSGLRRTSRAEQIHRSDEDSSCERRLEEVRWRLSNSTLSQCDVASVWSDLSAVSGTTFNTRDEAAFRDGLSALDASIASLQRTIQLDLGR